MARKDMYAAKVNSPATQLAKNISLTDTQIELKSAAVLPAPPNLLVVFSNIEDTSAETMRYTAINGDIITVERGFQGAAKAWSAGTTVARAFTAYDHDTFIENIEDLQAQADGLQTQTADLQTQVDDLKTQSTSLQTQADGLQDSKAEKAHTHAIANVDGLEAELQSFADYYGAMQTAMTEWDAAIQTAITQMSGDGYDGTNSIQANAAAIAALNTALAALTQYVKQTVVLTQAAYDALPDSKLIDGKEYHIVG